MLRKSILFLLGTVMILSAYGLTRLHGEDSPSERWQARSMVITRAGDCGHQPDAGFAGRGANPGAGRFGHADAAIAANAVMGVVEPDEQRHGGRPLRDCWEAKTGKLYGHQRQRLGARQAHHRLLEVRRVLNKWPRRGSTRSPCRDAWTAGQALHKRFGRLPWSDTFPARHLLCAEMVFPVTEIISRRLEG